MEKKRKANKNEKLETRNKEYLLKIFAMIRQTENIAVVNRESRFNHTELRLFFEVAFAKYSGKRLISTQLASRLGVTRSAVSQMVNKMEKEGLLIRVPDEVDRKIAYIQLTEEAMEAYQGEFNAAAEFVGRIVDEFGETKMEKLLSLSEEFSSIVSEMKK